MRRGPRADVHDIMSESMRTIVGGCHCGNIDYTLHWPDAGDAIAVRACACTFCRKHGGVYTSHPEARLEAHIADEALLNRYTFGTGTARFHICRRCGAVPFVTSAIGEAEYAVVNVNTFENVEPQELVSSTADFDGESVEDRLARRERNWIAHVTVEVRRS